MAINWDADIGVILRREALAQGLDDREIRRLVRAKVWCRVRQGAYFDAQTWDGLNEVERHRVRARAVLKTAHPSAVLSHVSAALEHDAPVWGVDLSEIHLTRTDGRSGRREAGVAHHRGDLDAEDVSERHGVPVTEPGRASLELTTMTTVESALVTMNWCLAREKTTKAHLEALVQKFRHWPHTLRSDLAVRLSDGRCAWPGEARISYLLWKLQLPEAQPQVEVFDVSGHILGIVDFAWPHLGVFLEFDGKIKYKRLLRDGETLEDVIRREKRREELICARTGWVCIRVTWEDLARPVATARRIRALLDSRRALIR